MVVRMRHTRAHTANRRSHHALEKTRLSATKDGAVHPRHRALLDGTQYRGRTVLDVSAKRTVRAKKASKQRERDTGVSEEKKETEEKKA